MNAFDIILIVIILVIVCCIILCVGKGSFTYFGGRRNSMKWSNEINLSTFWDSWWTYRENYMGKNNNLILTLDEFAKKCINDSTYKDMSIQTLLDDYETHNIGKHRLNANTPEEAYPPNDRPRGQKDIETIKSLIKSNECIPPIVIIQSGDKKSSWICLDGTHRLVAAKLRDGFRSVVRVCFIRNKSAQYQN
jgi:hypothetical protein